MGRIVAIFLAVSTLTGCAFDADEATDGRAPQAQDVQGDGSGDEASTPPEYPDDNDEYWSSNPCEGAGEIFVIDGREVFVPIECDPNYQDMGDPPELSGDPGHVT